MDTTSQNEIPPSTSRPSLNSDALNQLLGKMVNDLGAAVSGALIVLGDGLGLYAALAEIGPATSWQLAEKAKVHERQLREWLCAQAASGYITYDAAKDAFFAIRTTAARDRSPPSARKSLRPPGGSFLR